MLWAQPDNPLMWVAKAGMIPFFVVHYGIFTTVHGVFVLTLFGGVHERGFPGPTAFFHAVQGAGIWPAALALGRVTPCRLRSTTSEGASTARPHWPA